MRKFGTLCHHTSAVFWSAPFASESTDRSGVTNKTEKTTQVRLECLLRFNGAAFGCRFKEAARLASLVGNGFIDSVGHMWHSMREEQISGCKLSVSMNHSEPERDTVQTKNGDTRLSIELKSVNTPVASNEYSSFGCSAVDIAATSPSVSAGHSVLRPCPLSAFGCSSEHGDSCTSWSGYTLLAKSGEDILG
jgi:hypothetical protein